ncbi:MAG: type II toxin-antitoxin system HicB family antitoxin [Pararhizobium sp.]
MIHYIALIHKEASSGYGVSFPDVPGVTAVADTLDDALREAGVALGFAFEDWPGERPVRRTLDELHTDRQFRADAAGAIIAAVAPIMESAKAA